jgi:hypothetical protein
MGEKIGCKENKHARKRRRSTDQIGIAVICCPVWNRYCEVFHHSKKGSGKTLIFSRDVIFLVCNVLGLDIEKKIEKIQRDSSLLELVDVSSTGLRLTRRSSEGKRKLTPHFQA